MKRVRKSLSLEARKLLYFAHIHSQLMYCIPLYILSNQTELDKLLKLQKKALRITYNKSYNYPSSPLFHDIGTIPINDLVEKEIVKLMHNIESYKKPASLLQFFRGKYDNPYYLKELYTSISTLAQTLVLTLLNNEFILKILNSTPFGRKIRKHFRPKNHKSRFSA